MRNNSFTKNLLCQIFTIILLSSVLSGTFSVSAQTRRKPSPAPKMNQPVSAPKQGCAGGWKGIVNYKKILKESLESDEPGIRKNTDRIKHRTSRDFDYSGRAIVNGTDPQNAVVNTKVNFTDDDLNWGEERVFDTCNATENGHWFVYRRRGQPQNGSEGGGFGGIV